MLLDQNDELLAILGMYLLNTRIKELDKCVRTLDYKQPKTQPQMV